MSIDKNQLKTENYPPDILQYIADDVNVEYHKVENVVRLLTNDNTVAFIARYRRDITGDMQVTQIRNIKESLERVKTVENRKNSVMKNIHQKLTPEIINSLKLARTLQEIDDIYAPFKPGVKGTLASRAIDLGLGKACDLVFHNYNVENINGFIQPGKKGVSTFQEVKNGVQCILADQISKDKHACDLLKRLFEASHITLDTKIKKEIQDRKYKDYHESSISIKRIQSHQILAISRAENEKILSVKLNSPENLKDMFLREAEKQRIYNISAGSAFRRELMRKSLLDSYTRLMLPKLKRQTRCELYEKAQRESVKVFAENLRRLLLASPLTGRNVLAIDPGFKHGCKIAIVNENGAILQTAVLDLLGRDARQCEKKLQGLLIEHNCYTIALGNGKGCRETESLITRMKKDGKLKNDVVYSIVGEEGASIYSVSEEAEKEMPNLDVNLRSAVSIARRLQNPMLELIKIEPKHIGVGMYQHDMPEQMLQQALNGVLEDCVSLVGVDLNASGIHALKRIAGLNERKAKEIIAWREKNGLFRSREQLKEVRGIGEKTFEQCAGFVRIFQHHEERIAIDTESDETVKSNNSKLAGKRKADGSGPSTSKKRKHTPSLIVSNIFDSTSIHPESYTTATKLVNLTKASMADVGQTQIKGKIDDFINKKGFSTVCTMLECNAETLRLIVHGLTQKIGHDIRADFAKPLFKQAIMSIDDIHGGTNLTGRVTNMTTFGAFVDVGVGRDGLIHKSAITCCNNLGVGDIVDVVCVSVENNRIALRLK